MFKMILAGLLVIGLQPSDAKTKSNRKYLKPKPVSVSQKQNIPQPGKPVIAGTGTRANYNIGEQPYGTTGTFPTGWTRPPNFPSNYDYKIGASTFSGSSSYTIASDGCSGTTLPYNGDCPISVSYDLSAYKVNSAVLTTPYTVEWIDDDNQPQSVSGTVTHTFSAFVPETPPPYEENPSSLDEQRQACGSIIQVDSLALGEEIPVVGTDFSLSYVSSNASQFVTTQPKANRVAVFNPEGLSVSGHHYYDRTNLRLFDGAGSSRSAKYIGAGNEFIVASSDGSEIYYFDSTGMHVKTRHGITGTVIRTFNYSAGKLASIVDGYGRTTYFNRNGSGILTSITAPFGQITTIGTNGSGLITSVSNPMSQVYALTYKSGTELLQTFTKPGGQVATFSYDTDGKLTQDLGNGGNSWDFLLSLLVDQRTVDKTSAMSRNEINYYWAENGDNHAYVDYPSGSWNDQVEKFNNGGTAYYEEDYGVTAFTTVDERLGILHSRPVVESVLAADEDYNFYQKDTVMSRVVDGVSDLFNYTTIEDTTSVNTRVVSTQVYTKNNKTFLMTSNEGAVSSKAIDEFGNILSRKTGNDDSWNYVYDWAGRLSYKSQGIGKNVGEYTYNSAGFLQSEKNGRNEITSYAYDLAGRVTQITLPDTRVIGFGYDANGNRTSIIPPSRPAHEFEFNAMELMGKYKPPTLTGVAVKDTMYSYNLDKQLTSVVRPDTQSATYVYGSSSGLLEEVQLARGTDYYSYKPWTEHVSQIDSADGIRSKYAYFGRQLNSEEQRLVVTDDLLAKVKYLYDEEHRNIGRVLYGNGSTSTIDISYNGDSEPTQIGDMSLTYSYPSGRLSTTTLDKISDVRTYDSRGNLESYTATYNPTSGSPVQLYTYTLSRDSMSRIVGKSESIGGVTSTYVYGYDTAGRLTSVDKNSTNTSSYTYDNNGNKTSGSIGGVPFTATYDNQDRINSWNSVTYSHNANGDNTGIQWTVSSASSFSYDALGRLISATTPTQSLTYEYDGRGRQVRVASGGSTLVRRIYESDLRIAAEFDDSGNISKEYVYGTSVNAPEYLISGVRLPEKTDPT